MILIALGLFGLACGGFTVRDREKVVDIGPIHATRGKTHTAASDHTGGVALNGGVLLLLTRRGVTLVQPARADV
jgi:hypothetical protein